MKAVLKKEFKSYMTSMTGYIFLFFILLVFGIYFTAINVQQAYPEIGYVFGNMSFVFLIAVPILTMRLMAEEQKNKTDQLLLTSPVKVSAIIMGKYGAVLAVYLIGTAVICVYPLVLGWHGTVSYPMAYTSILGFFLFGAAFIAVGLFISSLTESQIIAAVLSFIVFFISYVEEGIAGFFSGSGKTSLAAFMVIALLMCLWVGRTTKNIYIFFGMSIVTEAVLLVFYQVNPAWFERKIQDFLGIFNVVGHMDYFIYGILDLGNIVYFLSVIAISLFLAVQTVEKRRWA